MIGIASFDYQFDVDITWPFDCWSNGIDDKKYFRAPQRRDCFIGSFG